QDRIDGWPRWRRPGAAQHAGRVISPTDVLPSPNASPPRSPEEHAGDIHAPASKGARPTLRAIDGDVGAVDPRRALRQKEHHYVGHLLGRAQPTRGELAPFELREPLAML